MNAFLHLFISCFSYFFSLFLQFFFLYLSRTWWDNPFTLIIYFSPSNNDWNHTDKCYENEFWHRDCNWESSANNFFYNNNDKTWWQQQIISCNCLKARFKFPNCGMLYYIVLFCITLDAACSESQFCLPEKPPKTFSLSFHHHILIMVVA